MSNIPAFRYVPMEDDLARNHGFHGFPVVHGRKLMGLVTHAKLKMAIGIVLLLFLKCEFLWLITPTDAYYSDDLETMRTRRCTFYPQSPIQSSDGIIDMSQYLENTILHLRKEVPLEITVAMFQQLASPFPSAIVYMALM
jgi:chloride channel 3/4/5